MDVGDFTPTETTDPQADPDTFTYFGETFEIPAAAGAGALLKFTHLVKEADKLAQRGQAALRRALTDDSRLKARRDLVDADLTASSAMYQLLKACLGEDQVDHLMFVADANGVTQDGLMNVCDRIQEVIGGRPTRRSADSSAGPLMSGPDSTAGGSGSTEPAPATEPGPEMTPRDRQMAEIFAGSTSLAGSPA